MRAIAEGMRCIRSLLFTRKKRINIQGRAQKFEKGGGAAISCLHVSTENIGEDQKKKGQRVLRCPVSTVSLTADIYQLYIAPLPLDTPLTLDDDDFRHTRGIT